MMRGSDAHVSVASGLEHLQYPWTRFSRSLGRLPKSFQSFQSRKIGDSSGLWEIGLQGREGGVNMACTRRQKR